MTVDQIRELAAPDMARVNTVIQTKLASDVALINQLSQYIIGAGGKRFRPMVLMLAAKALGGKSPWAAQMAVVVELIHTATLLHDDVVDESTLRRGRDTANALFGNAASVLTGDFLYSRAFEMMVEVQQPRVMAILAQATNRIAEGEVLQLMNVGDADVSEERYVDVIIRKTATLFAAATQLAAVLEGQPEEMEAALTAYGLHLGTAFQLIDDVLDYTGDEAQTGKHVGDDLAEGKPTLPLIIAMQRGDEATVAMIRRAITEQDARDIEAICAAIELTGALAYTAHRAQAEADRAKQAIAAVPDSPFKEALLALADAAVARNH
ncbi:MAG: octaprenyl diphosphate synthase [Halothiobacillus sp. 14-56-357]|uniref:polyprenyl synthetase family protein n=1 Tax=Halothiobacillus sp. 15-55-196 TaxID=1970382 RepID=UPI000BC6B73F|nr:polyprenyl synthetase family protein [Halothiobacillus sp. 15-55-196]OZB36732.1 MAG: octaprenyl diphosphate synthase [Halothiobacillus sp. 15-55-196]OZB56757.1 MAG: octaprenyl diphosphate synthase [Halothiobacillus sp. 14-56-357]OZB78458.1 MAG: octaprenyl diphosphate synthase [Halothiobacillus sp. 13-55-115]